MGPEGFDFRVDVPGFTPQYGVYFQRLLQAWADYQESGGRDDYTTFSQRWMADNPYTPGQSDSGSGQGPGLPPGSGGDSEGGDSEGGIVPLPPNYYGIAPTGNLGQYTANDILVTSSEQPNMYDTYDPYAFTPVENPYDNVVMDLPYTYTAPTDPTPDIVVETEEADPLDPLPEAPETNPIVSEPTDPDPIVPEPTDPVVIDPQPPSNPDALLNSFFDQLQEGDYIYGSVGEAYERGDLSRDQMLRFRAALDDFTGTTIGNRPYEIGDVVGGIGLLPEPDPEPAPKPKPEPKPEPEPDPPQAGGPGRRPTDDEIEAMQHPSNLGLFSLGGKVDASRGSGEGLESFLLEYRDPRTVEQERRMAAFKRNMQAAMQAQMQPQMQPQMPQQMQMMPQGPMPAAPGPQMMPQGTMQQGIMPIASQRQYG